MNSLNKGVTRADSTILSIRINKGTADKLRRTYEKAGTTASSFNDYLRHILTDYAERKR